MRTEEIVNKLRELAAFHDEPELYFIANLLETRMHLTGLKPKPKRYRPSPRGLPTRARLELAIRRFADENPHLTTAQIAEHFRLTPSQVSAQLCQART